MENPSKLCPECYAQEEVYERTIGEYLRKKGRATVEEIHIDTEVDEKIIIRMLKSGRLFSDGMIGYPCEMCREPIYAGRLCTDCSNGLTKQVKKSNEDRKINEQIDQQNKGIRMYTTKK